MIRYLTALLLTVFFTLAAHADTASVKEWQGIVGVTQDGSFGPATLSASKAKIGYATPPPAKPEVPATGDMIPSNRGIVFLSANEGAVPGPYLDSVKVWTYGEVA